jgi:hypothetical protein
MEFLLDNGNCSTDNIYVCLDSHHHMLFQLTYQQHGYSHILINAIHRRNYRKASQESYHAFTSFNSLN